MIAVGEDAHVDVHYRINGGAQQNLCMTHSGGNNSYQLINVAPGASVTYRFTIGLAAGGATETAWITFTMGGGGGAHGHTISGSNVQFYVNNAPWVDVHYTINGGEQLNVRMVPAGGNNTYTVPNVPGGAIVRYRFTIAVAAGGATESAWVTFTKYDRTASAAPDPASAALRYERGESARHRPLSLRPGSP